MRKTAYTLARIARRVAGGIVRRGDGGMSAITGEHESGVSRRDALALTLVGAAGAAGLQAEASEAGATGYPRLRIVSLTGLQVNRAVSFDYPLRGQVSMLLDLGRAVPEGIGPSGGIVAYSTLCQHMGCPVAYDHGLRVFKCPCHQTRYDPERLGSIVQGVATRALPRVLLEVRDGAVYAIGIDGLIYGYRTNLAPGRKVRSRS
jgi:arsenite oxidase small subunit